MTKEVHEVPIAPRKKRIKLHAEMFMTDGMPDMSLLLERGMHLNNLALRAFVESEKDSSLNILSHDQEAYIKKVHLPQCVECKKRLDSVRLQQAQQEEIPM